MASTYYISADTGVDTGAGGSGAPWLTIAYAYDHSTIGDTLYLQNSTAHFAWVTDTITNRTLTGQSAEGCIIDASNTNVVWTITGGDITVNTVTFTGALTSAYAIFVIASLNTFIFNNVIFRDLTFTSTPASAGMFGNSNGATPFGTLTFNNCVFDTCYCNSIANSGFVCCRSATTSTFVNVIGCSIYLPVPVAGKYNPECFSTGSPGYGAQNYLVKNTVFENVGGGTFNTESTLCYYNTTYTLTYSCRHNTGIGGNMPSYPASQPTSVVGTITSDPLFVDALNRNFNLRPTSPCIDTGILL